MGKTWKQIWKELKVGVDVATNPKPKEIFHRGEIVQVNYGDEAPKDDRQPRLREREVEIRTRETYRDDD